MTDYTLLAIGAIILNAIFTGIGVAIGTYIANNHIIKGARKLRKKLKKR